MGEQDDVVTSLERSSARMAAAAPVFVVGHHRCGTSLLYRTLQQHPAFAPRRVELSETQIVRRLPLAYRWDTRMPRQLARFMLKDEAHLAAFLAETRTLRRRALLTAPLALPRRGDLPLALWRAQGLHLVVRSYLAHAWQARGCRRLVEKSPRNVPHAAKLRLVSPGATQVFMVRHPVEVYASLRKRVAADPSARWADLSPRRFVARYHGAAAGALAEAVDPSFVVLRYEDLTADPAATMGRLYDLLGEPFVDPERTGPGEHGHAAPPRPLDGPIRTRTTHWQDHVGPGEARRLQDRLGDVMEALGYDRYA